MNEVAVPQHPGNARTRLYGPGVYARRLLDIAAFFFLAKFTEKPLRFFGLVGSVLLRAGAVTSLVLLVEPDRGPGHRQPARCCCSPCCCWRSASSSWDSAWSARSSSICARRTAGPIVCASGPEPEPSEPPRAMRRDLSRLAGTAHDLLVIGGGIQGACIAWDAALRGLTVALVERDDFGAATSANSLRIVHGGIRYLARGDLARMRESIRERSALLRIAPGLVEPLPVLIPTGAPGVPGRAAFGAALALTHALSLTRNRHLHPARRIAAGRILSRAECLRLFPALDPDSTTGGALWYDARMTGSGAADARVRRLGGRRRRPGGQPRRGGRVRPGRGLGTRGGAAARAGVRPAQRRAVRRAGQASGHRGGALDRGSRRARGEARCRGWRAAPRLAMNLVIGRRVADVAVGLRSSGSSEDDPGGSGGRFLFLAPQASTTLLGTWYGVAREGDDAETVLDRGADGSWPSSTAACPGLGLGGGDIVGRQWGRLPLKAGLERGPAATLAERPRMVRAATVAPATC